MNITKNIAQSEAYEKLIFDRTTDKENVLRALEIVKLYIIKHKLILVGGMAIDYALRKKGKKLYPDDELPDYDFFSPNFHVDSYNIANELWKAGLRNISAINAYHASTMRVRVDFQVVADCTYVPENIFEKMPYIGWKGFRVIHPHYQMLNQHLSLSSPYAGSPWETIHRWKKDMQRYNILDREYPVADKGGKSTIKTAKFSLKRLDIKNMAVNGFAAVAYWFEEAKKLGFDSNGGDLKTSWKDNKNMIEVSIPEVSLDNFKISLSFYSEARNLLELPLVKNGGNLKYYNAFLDLIPRRIVLENMEILDSRGIQRSAFPLDGGIWIINLQGLLMYFLLNYIMYENHEFYLAYKLSYDIVKWAAEKYKASLKDNDNFLPFLPYHKVYGTYSWHETYILQRKHFQQTLGKIPREPNGKPSVAYLETDDQYPVDKEKFDFIPSSSEVYQFDYKERKDMFPQIILYDLEIDG